MKNNYRKFKLSILSQTVLITVLTGCVGYILLEVFVYGVFRQRFGNGVVRILTFMGVNNETAMHLYWDLIGNNKQMLMLLGFFILFFVFVYIALSKLTRYLDQLSDGIENVIVDSDEPITLIEELHPIEDKLNEIKYRLRAQKAEAEESERKKNEMVAFLAHDLKTPLTSIIAYLSALDSEQDMQPADREKYTRITLEKAVRLSDLIQEFFEITRYNLQKIELDAGELDISMMLEQLADELYPVLRENELSCTVNAEERLVIDGDPDKLARVFENLLRNAISYSYRNTNIVISAKAVTSDETDQNVEIIFQNKGPVIPEEQIQTIFEKFYRIDNSRSSQTGGAGLGLAIAKEITELHGGNIRAESENETIKFIVTLPRKVSV